jgi:hypothetical protein
MKKLLYTFLTVSIIFAACKKGDGITTGISSNTSGSIIGTWNLIQYATTSNEGYYTNYPIGKISTWDTSTIMTLPHPDFFESITWEFFNNQTMEELITEYGEPDSVDTDFYTWTKNGNTLVLDSGWTVTINTLTTSELYWTDGYEDTTSYYDHYNPSTGDWDYGYGDTLFFNGHNGTADWNKTSGLSPNTSNARIKQNNIKESPFSSRFLNRRKNNKDY